MCFYLVSFCYPYYDTRYSRLSELITAEELISDKLANEYCQSERQWSYRTSPGLLVWTQDYAHTNTTSAITNQGEV